MQEILADDVTKGQSLDNAGGGATQARWSFVIGGFACLLGGAFYDNIRGPLLPPMAESLAIEFTELGWFLAVGYAAAALTTLALMKALHWWSEGRVTGFLAGIGACAGLVSFWVTNRPTLYLLAGLVGCTVSTLGTMSNVLVVRGAPRERESRYLSALHGMYGVGSALATWVVGQLIAREFPWYIPYSVGIPFFLALGVFSYWRLKTPTEKKLDPNKSQKLTAVHFFVVFMFGLYVGGEVMTATWMTTYLVRMRGLSVSESTTYLSVYFLIMTSIRLGCALFLKPQFERWILRLSLVIPVLFFIVGYSGALWAFPLMGLYGPFFPVFLSRVSRVFHQASRNLTIMIMVGMNIVLGISNVGLGRLADKMGMEKAYILAPVLLLTGFCLLHVYFWLEKKLGWHDV